MDDSGIDDKPTGRPSRFGSLDVARCFPSRTQTEGEVTISFILHSSSDTFYFLTQQTILVLKITPTPAASEQNNNPNNAGVPIPWWSDGLRTRLHLKF